MESHSIEEMKGIGTRHALQSCRCYREVFLDDEGADNARDCVGSVKQGCWGTPGPVVEFGGEVRDGLVLFETERVFISPWLIYPWSGRLLLEVGRGNKTYQLGDAILIRFNILIPCLKALRKRPPHSFGNTTWAAESNFWIRDWCSCPWLVEEDFELLERGHPRRVELQTLTHD